MGAGIAEVVAAGGFDVVLRSRTAASADDAVAKLRGACDRHVSKGRMDQDAANALLARIETCTELADLAQCDLIIESVAEDISIKRAIFAELDKVCMPHTILATNTSTLPVMEMALVTERPEKVCGIHFFNPAPAMPLVEVVTPETATEDTIVAAVDFATACGKDPVRVKDRAGFIVNALLFPYLNNAARMLSAGTASAPDIDTAMRGGCNMPMGPLSLLDLVGIDTSVSILDTLHKASGDSNYEPVPVLRELLEAGKLGRKSGQGFFEYPR